MLHKDRALQNKIDSFMNRKQHEYPELNDFRELL
jgi:hypothetical protein